MRVQVFKIKGIPIYITWSIIIAIFLFLYLNGFDVISSLLSISAYIFLVFIHELGHFYFAKRAGLRVIEIQISAFGGHCLFEATKNRMSALLIIAGGVIFQIFVLAFSIAFVMVSKKEVLSFFEPLLLVLIHFNILLILVNVIPANLPGSQKNDGMCFFNLLRAKSHKQT